MKSPTSLVLTGTVLAGAIVAGVAWHAAAQPAASPQSPASTYAVPPALNDGWKTGSLEQAGIDRRRLEAMTTSIRANPALNVHAVLIERDGRLVYEEYFSGTDQRWGQPLGVVVFTRETRHDLRSVTKSVVSALVGVAQSSGVIRSLDTPLLDYFPEYTDLQVAERRQITIRHALMMSAGLEWNEDVPYTDPKNDEIVMVARVLSDVLGSRRGPDRGWERRATDLPPARATDGRDRSRGTLQRFQCEPAGASAPRVHPSGTAAGAQVRVPDTRQPVLSV